MSNHRSARTGKYVSKAVAKRAPATTVKEKRTRCAEIERCAKALLRAYDAVRAPGHTPKTFGRALAARKRYAEALRRALARKE